MVDQPLSLKASERDTTLTARQLRAAGYLPATVYGADMPNTSIQVKAFDFTRDYGQHGVTRFQLTGLPGDPVVSVHQVQQDAVSRKYLAVEFLIGEAKPSKAQAKPAEKAKIEQPQAEAGASSQAVEQPVDEVKTEEPSAEPANSDEAEKETVLSNS